METRTQPSGALSIGIHSIIFYPVTGGGDKGLGIANVQQALLGHFQVIQDRSSVGLI